MTARLRNNKGITLVELIIVVALIGIIAVPITTMFVHYYVAYYRDNIKISVASDMRLALNTVLDNLRMAEQDSIEIVGSHRVNFQIVGSGGTQNCHIRYDSAAKALKLTKGGSEETLLSNVTDVEIKSVAASAAETGRISVTCTTSTRVPMGDDYVFTKTYDYIKRT